MGDVIAGIYIVGCILSGFLTYILARGYERTGESNISEFAEMFPFMTLCSLVNVFILLYNKNYRHILIEGLKWLKK